MTRQTAKAMPAQVAAGRDFQWMGGGIVRLGAVHSYTSRKRRTMRLADDIQSQGDQEKHQADGEDAVVVDRVVAQVAAADAHDVPGHGFGAVEGVEGEIGAGADADGDDHRLADGA